MQMVKCPACGEENPAKFRLCGYCGAPLAQAAAATLPAHEIRKTVTLIFSDLKDSTVLGERLDSEALHEVKERYFAAMAAEIRRHGGKIEKYIGDAIMAVFGLPRAHEDDALRAVRAAVGMRTALGELNETLKARFGVTLAARTGVNTGEVVAMDDPSADQKLATGDAVNVTARLEQAAPPDEIYIGEVTYRLVRDAVQAEAVEPLTLKGKSQPVPAFRIITAHGLYGNERRVDTPVVGRDDELAALQSAWDAAVATRRAELVTVIGDAGVGKSRLVRELMNRVGERARFVFGRCLAYGEGITFWPLREIVVAAADIDRDDTPEQARAKVLALAGEDEVAERLASAMGLSTRQFPLHEINWGARRLMQRLAADGPVLAMIDDIHWAEPAFLDLMESLLDTIEGAAVLIVATARHDLLETRAEWGERERSTRLILQPLSDAAATEVVTNLLGAAGLPPALVTRIVDAAEGNPLYVEQMLSMLIDSGAVSAEGELRPNTRIDTDIVVPPTINALLEARLDQLERAERAAAEPASVIGMEFARSAVQSLAPVPLRDRLGEQLQALTRKRFIRPAMPDDDDPRFRFDHHLVRDTVYNGLLKRARATMHVEFVKWADEVNAQSDRGREFEAILGYHLEQAYKYLGELGPIDEAGVAIGRDGARRLASAGRRALGRGDMHAAENLYARAVQLLDRNSPARAELMPNYGEVLMELGQFVRAREALAEACAIADANQMHRLAIGVKVADSLVSLYSASAPNWADQAQEIAAAAIASLKFSDANEELANAYRLLALAKQNMGQLAPAADAIEKVTLHARLAGNDRLVARSGLGLSMSLLYGPTPVDQALRQCESLLAHDLGDRQVRAVIMCKVAHLRAMNEEFDEARVLYQSARRLLGELGRGVHAASTASDVLSVETLAGDLMAAEREAKVDLAFLAESGETFFLASLSALLARVVREQGRNEEAMELTRQAEAAAAEDDWDAQILWRAVRAPILADAGDQNQAKELMAAALESARTVDDPMLRADTLFEAARLKRIEGDLQASKALVEEASAMCIAKGNKAALARISNWAAQMLDI